MLVVIRCKECSKSFCKIRLWSRILRISDCSAL